MSLDYIIRPKDRDQHLLEIELHVPDAAGRLEVQLPAWRPGRYQLADFARNLYRLDAYDAHGKALEVEKLSKDRWQVHTGDIPGCSLHYTYYANEMNAGSTFLDGEQLYLNPVNCCLYVPGREDEFHRLTLELPEDHEVVSGLRQESSHTLVAEDMQELMDGPFIASAGLKKHSFEESGVRFHLCFQGECKPDFEKLEKDFRPFIREQIAAFGEFPVDEYHFLFQILPYRTFHGVEHCNSTVIVLGPSYRIMEGKGYEELVAVSSHELYHTWNVKRIRPEALLPYDFTKENYTRLGYIMEGVTTYMGDKMLLRSGFYSSDRYLEKLAGMLQRHFDNPGRQNLSVADSSFDTWLDGYDRDVPGRKVSIYNEGALVAFMLDVLILEERGGERSLDHVMAGLYKEYACKGKGISEEVLLSMLEAIAGISFVSFFRDHVNGTADHTPLLVRCFEQLGVHWEAIPSERFHEAWLGIRVRNEKGSPVIDSVHPGSPAEKAGLTSGDRILGVNGYETGFEEFSSWCAYFEKKPLQLLLVRERELMQRELEPGTVPQIRRQTLEKKEKGPKGTDTFFQDWSTSRS